VPSEFDDVWVPVDVRVEPEPLLDSPPPGPADVPASVVDPLVVEPAEELLLGLPSSPHAPIMAASRASKSQVLERVGRFMMQDTHGQLRWIPRMFRPMGRDRCSATSLRALSHECVMLFSISRCLANDFNLRRTHTMRMMMKVSVPVETGNKTIENETLPKTMMNFVEKMKPEAAYFVAENGKRTGIFVFDLADPSLIPSAAEPFFMKLNAHIELTPAMNVEDMKKGVQRAMQNR
jgi:hypothetical protein